MDQPRAVGAIRELLDSVRADWDSMLVRWRRVVGVTVCGTPIRGAWEETSFGTY